MPLLSLCVYVCACVCACVMEGGKAMAGIKPCKSFLLTSVSFFPCVGSSSPTSWRSSPGHGGGWTASGGGGGGGLCQRGGGGRMGGGLQEPKTTVDRNVKHLYF